MPTTAPLLDSPATAGARRAGLVGATLTAVSLLAACGGGGEATGTEAAAASTTTPTTTTAAAVPTCNTALFVAGSVEAPTAAQRTAYAGTYVGDEGAFSTGSGVFTKSGTATVVLEADAKLSYQGTAYTVLSLCIDKSEGPYGRVLYAHTDKGHIDVASKVDPTLGNAWGVSPVNGTTLFRAAKKQ